MPSNYTSDNLNSNNISTNSFDLFDLVVGGVCLISVGLAGLAANVICLLVLRRPALKCGRQVSIHFHNQFLKITIIEQHIYKSCYYYVFLYDLLENIHIHTYIFLPVPQPNNKSLPQMLMDQFQLIPKIPGLLSNFFYPYIFMKKLFGKTVFFKKIFSLYLGTIHILRHLHWGEEGLSK